MNLFLMPGVGFEPTRLSPYDLKSYPLDHSGIPAFKNVFTFSTFY